MLELVKQEKITIEKVVEKMSHHPAICFQIEKRGFIRKNYFADLVLVDKIQVGSKRVISCISVCLLLKDKVLTQKLHILW